ncbi:MULTISPECIES: hypothetical protein [Campylobacter]|uniref:Uncharacterized protein n=1 Tax=Campylobacter curvus (strain 525.92) TaxID=360105 RepID=A7GY04_CAMC5|nr:MULTISPECIES: hypothetical protein [Campylobacter]EAU00490.1 hypothetical protein CCV52592_1379 [Campylobacter curvus 525.92]EJP74184.1 hypothetical protein HMPREF1139_0339 [Campylobacter sp. FOBRC14]MBN7289202.1 hypothetical protein [Campylobacter curvus]MDU6826366.1 hypothetical protein [Campylobacter sp.]QKF61100.1 hypothetical protein CCVT_0796 [Campylobacter curvus]
MQQTKAFALSDTRLPFDHFLSGALIAGMSAAAISFNEHANDPSKDKLQTAKKILKFSVCGGFVTAIAISASNSIARGRYLGAATKISLGVGGLLIAEKIINLENK